jgi:hypothetical protein
VSPNGLNIAFGSLANGCSGEKFGGAVGIVGKLMILGNEGIIDTTIE